MLRSSLQSPLQSSLASPFGEASEGGQGVSEFAFAAETDTLAAAFAVAPTANRKRTIDRAIKRLKAAGIWAKTTAMYFVGLNENASFKNWKTPGTFDLTKNGTPTFAANDGWTWTTAGQYLNTNMPANTLTQDDCGHYIWNKAAPAVSSGSRYGAINASSAGFSIAIRSTSDGMAGRCGGGNATVAGVNNSDGIGLHGISRRNSAEMTGSKGGVTKTTSATVSSALPTINITLLALNNNGTVGNGIVNEKHCFWWFGKGLVESEERVLAAVVGDYLDSILHGDVYMEEVGEGEEAIAADCVGYGFTLDSIAFCVQAAREGKSAALCGGWRDRWNFGGMAGGGLGYTDFDSDVGLGGLSRWAITRANAIDGITDVASGTNPNAYKFQPKTMKKVLLELLATYAIPCYQTNGVVSVSKTGAEIQSFTTTDGRTFSGSQFFDGSYEKDLMRLAGITYRIGREAAGSGSESVNGVENIATAAEPLNGAGVAVTVDPWLTPADPGSGLVAGIQAVSSTFHPLLDTLADTGTADSGIPAYNFRLTMTSTITNRVPLPSTPPEGFDEDNYELFIRWIEAADLSGSDLTLDSIFKMDDLRTSGRHDVNNRGILSTNLVGENHAYPLASYAQREVIWKNVWNYIMGIWYVLQHHNDIRIPSALRTSAISWGFCQDHYYTPHENDEIFHMPQMYVRESIRMESAVVMTATHMVQTDGQAPTLGDHTISVASYGMDSHSIQRVAVETSDGLWTIKNEGGMLITSAGGTDKIAPLPYEIAVPKVADCTNLSVGFGLSTTHVSFGTTRMEFTAMQSGQSMGLAAALAIDDDNIIQNVDYPTLRTALLASAVLAGEVAPVLPQTT